MIALFTQSEPDTCSFRRLRIDDMDKVKTTIKQFVRDWSLEGEAERESCYGPVIQALQNRLPLSENSSYNVLVPGAGLARLVFEIARLGYNCQGCEFSAYMLFASNYILNCKVTSHSLKLHPWVHSWSNNFTVADQVKEITLPDVSVSGNIPDGINFSMAAGDFLDVYDDENFWDCIPTVFFIDTAHNVLDYIEKIYAILKPGGYWINMGNFIFVAFSYVYLVITKVRYCIILPTLAVLILSSCHLSMFDLPF